MKKLIIILFIGFNIPLSADAFDAICERFGAKPGSQFHSSIMAAKVQNQQTASLQERNALMQQIATINEYFTSIEAYRSSARSGQIISLLQSVGTPVALQLLADLRKNGSI
jgi:hypothetical protein